MISVARRWSAGQPLPTAVRPSAFHSATVIQREWRACTRGQVGDTAVPAIARLSIVAGTPTRSEEHTSELQSLMRISYAVFCLKKKTKQTNTQITYKDSTHRRLAQD